MALVGAGLAGKKKYVQDPNGYYPTPAPTTRSVIPLLDLCQFPAKLWECCAGGGHMSRVLRRDGGFSVHDSDLINRGIGAERSDFLKTTHARAPAIVTNPPFKLAHAMLEHAFVMLGVEYVAFLLSNNYWTAKERVALFRAFPPKLVCPMTWRIDITGDGASTMMFQWVVWSPHIPVIANPTFFFPVATDEKRPGDIMQQ
jgi:hypothetical protein